MNNLGKNIKSFRKSARLSQEQVGAVLGLNRSSVSKIERGETFVVKPEHIVRLCELFKCEPSDLYGIETVRVQSSVPMCDEAHEIISLLPLLDQQQAAAVLEMIRVMLRAGL